jgi:hypothetical protein
VFVCNFFFLHVYINSFDYLVTLIMRVSVNLFRVFPETPGVEMGTLRVNILFYATLFLLNKKPNIETGNILVMICRFGIWK